MDADETPEDDELPDAWKKMDAELEEIRKARQERVNDEVVRAAVAAIRDAGPEVRIGRMDFMQDRHRIHDDLVPIDMGGVREHLTVLADYWDKYQKLAPEMEALCKERMWSVGAFIGPRLGHHLWPQLNPRAKAHYLAGASRLTVWEKTHTWMPDYSDTEISWDEESLAAFVCNAIYFNKNDRFLRAVSGKDLRAMTLSRDRHGHCKWMARDFTNLDWRLVDIFYECAVRSMNIPVMKYCLQHGAEPNPVLLVSRYTTRWVTALSHLMDKFLMRGSRYCGYTGGGTKDLVGLILQHEPHPEGNVLEGLNRPLYMAWSRNSKEVVDILLDRGAKFEGGYFSREPLSPELKAQVLPQSGMPHGASNAFGLSAKDPRKLLELWHAVNELIPLTPWHEVPWYEGGWCNYMIFGNFMGTVLKRNDPSYLERYVPRGLPLKLTLPDVVWAARQDPREGFSYLLREMGLDPVRTTARLQSVIHRLQPEWRGN
ncbi:hypothetical protein [Roseimicrobium sp. ORNL1]|uniref:hypothetical protein n=1 Tax=Roseimicrobium sp. ORNL1 TaxID=2711231 RepID=UPI0013E1F8DF|nr:hypothetical protein [Roseimicrobium sp. ORNL1]QIF02082.1 hypothetical protein G5S37_11240 [Roseimicrobium sp. ORNL1]